MARLALSALLAVVLTFTMGAVPSRAQSTAADEAALRLGAALSTQGVTRASLGVLGDAFSCPDARLVAYRRSTGEPQVVDQWYVASQLWADGALMRAVDQDPRISDTWCHLEKGFIFLDRLWDYNNAGYFPRSNPVGTVVEVGPRFGDDNALGGLALLAAAEVATDPQVARRYIHAAGREADFLRQSALWDETFGGGFWWNTGHGDSIEGKPAQTNALAALFFARLYQETGNPLDREWAERTLRWMDTVLYDPARSLYRWSVAYEQPVQRAGTRISPRVFNYDQSLAIQAQLATYALTREPARLARAQAVGAAIEPAFWSTELGSLNLEAGVEQVFTAFSAWTSLGHLALYEVDRDARWLSAARRNADGLAARLRAPDGGYGRRAYVCVDRVAAGCQDSQARVVVDHVLDGAALAWAQHLETALAERLSRLAEPAARGS